MIRHPTLRIGWAQLVAMTENWKSLPDKSCRISLSPDKSYLKCYAGHSCVFAYWNSFGNIPVIKANLLVQAIAAQKVSGCIENVEVSTFIHETR